MAGFRKDTTTVAQTAANTAATVTAALITAGIVTDQEGADAYFNARYAATLGELAPVVDADNKLFAETEAAAPATARSTGPRSTGSAGGREWSGTVEEARKLELRFGKFKEVTLGELENMSAEEAGKYGYPENAPGTKNGMAYIRYLAKNDSSPFTMKPAQLILDARKAESDAA